MSHDAVESGGFFSLADQETFDLSPGDGVAPHVPPDDSTDERS